MPLLSTFLAIFFSIFAILPLVVDSLGEPEYVLDLDDGAVFQRRLARKFSEDLVWDHRKELEIEGRVAVDDGVEIHLESAVVAGESPVGHIVVFAVLLRNIEGDFVQFVALPVKEDHIFAGLVVVAEAVADVEAEFVSARQDRLQTAPVPSVVVRPDASAPVEGAEGLFVGAKAVLLVSQFEIPVGGHAVDLLIEIEVLVFLKGSGYHHTLLRLVGEGHIEDKVLLVVAELGVCAVETPLAVRILKSHLHLARLPGDVAGNRSKRKLHLAHREQERRALGDLPRPGEVHHRRAESADISHIRDGQTQSAVVVSHIVVVPLLEPRFVRGDVFTVVLIHHLFGISRRLYVAFFVQKPGRFGNFSLLHDCTSKVKKYLTNIIFYAVFFVNTRFRFPTVYARPAARKDKTSS